MTDPQFPAPNQPVPPVQPAPESGDWAAFVPPSASTPTAGAASPPPFGQMSPPPPPASLPAPAPQSPYSAPDATYAAPNGAFAVPVGGYTATAGAYQSPRREAGSRRLGVLSFLLALIAVVATPILVGFAAFEIGLGVPASAGQIMANPESLAFLSPVREQVLWAEIAFWTGTALGLVALVTGIIAIARRRGRGFGIAAVVVSALGPIVFFSVFGIALSLGVGAAYAA